MGADLTGRGAMSATANRLETAVDRDLSRLTPGWSTLFVILGSVALTWPLFTWAQSSWLQATAGTFTSVLVVLPWAALAGIIAACLVLFVGGRLLTLAGSLLGGTADKWQTVAAVGWSALALIPGLLLPLLLLAEMMLRAIVNERAIHLLQFQGSYTADLLATAPYILSVLLMVSTLMLSFAFSRVGKFAPWRGLLSVLLVPVAVLLFFVAPMFLLLKYL